MTSAEIREDLQQDEAFDLIVLGSGAAGLTAAITAALQGLKVVVLESQAEIGGTSARSSGTVWIPDNSLLRAEGITDDGPRAARYLSALVGNAGPEAPWRRFLQAGPLVLDELMAKTDLTFKPFMSAADYRQDMPGAAAGGRALEPQAFDGRRLKSDFKRLASPLRELMVFGGMMVTRSEAAQLLRADRSLSALILAARLTLRFALDRLNNKRGTRLVLGNALIAALVKSCRDLGVAIHSDVEATRLLTDGGKVIGVSLRRNNETLSLLGHKGVVLAGGGFPASSEKRQQHLPSPTPPATPAAPGCLGTTLDLALSAGAALGPSGKDNGLWFPSSFYKRADGTTAVYPHIVLDRPKPGLIAVDRQGQRFANEALSYHEFVRAMYAQTDKGGDAIPAWLIVDRAFIRKHGLGVIRPRTPSLRRYVASGYLLEATTIAELATQADLPPEALKHTVSRFNEFARQGRDDDFHKGETIYERGNGDADVSPNPCLGEITQGPFYAVAVWPTPLGTSRGLLTDENARVLDTAGKPMLGLYACGNDAQSAFGGEYPGAGAQLGQALTFGWLAGLHAADIPLEDVGEPPPEPLSSFHRQQA
ncbi:FAD-dependent oxidoreductase [Roseibium sp.]|uniref:FAD-dependent oxidoreductase n=1 Tax=Roseibium sp. TaxID=1936156 RepID=UPI003A976068